jgi:hypothetical protein
MRRHPDMRHTLPNNNLGNIAATAIAMLVGIVVVGIFLGMVLAFLMSSAKARDNGQWETSDPMIRAWYRALMQPDNKTVSCCGFADAYYADLVETGPNGELIAVITDTRDDAPLGRPHVPVGTKIVVPRNKIKFDQGNPVGRNIIFLSAERSVYCFVDAGGV